MLFTGEYEHTIDAKHRLAVPSEIRSRLDPEVHGDGFYLAPGPNGVLWLWPQFTFEEMAGALDRTLLPDEDTMEYEEMLFSQAARVEIDKSGRIRVPERMLERYGLGGSVTILGVKDHLEIRDTAKWEARREQTLAKQAEITLRARRAYNEQRGGGRKDGP